MSCLCFVYLFACSGVQHMSCCVFGLVSSSCVLCIARFYGLSIFIAPSVFSDVYFVFNFQHVLATESKYM